MQTRSWSVTRSGRVIEATAWFPAATRVGGYPIVLFSHGLYAEPSDYRRLLSSWASRGIVVLAPTYPNTHRAAAQLQPTDVLHQPADAGAVLDAALRLGLAPGDPFHGRLDADHVVAAGHSLGAITTVGLISSCCRDARLRGALVLAGNDLGFSGVAGPPIPVLFVHGDADPLVPYSSGLAVYQSLGWPKAFITLTGEGHTQPFLGGAQVSARLVEAVGAAFVGAIAGEDRDPWTRVRAVVGDPGSVSWQSSPSAGSGSSSG